MTESPSPVLDDLLDRITAWPYGMPVRAMEEVLGHGEAAIPALAAALRRWQDDEERDLLWPIVLLGETRHADAVDALLGQMRRTELDILAHAAAEGLAKVGRPAVPGLVEVSRTGDPSQRLYAYAALGWIQDDDAYAALLGALGSDRELDAVIATALGDHARREALEPAYAAYRHCPPSQRRDFEEALRTLDRATPPAAIRTADWRLRYRRDPALGGSIELEWVGVAAILRGHGEEMGEPLPLRPLAEILGEPADLDEPQERCEDCGAPIFEPTGVAACPDTAVAVAVYQLKLLAAAREDGIEDLFELLDEVEADEDELRDQGEPRTPTARERWNGEVSELVVARQTCRWLIEQGVEHVTPARALLLAEAGRLGAIHGDPQGLLQERRPSARRPARIGRNDPCPCGSGRKYKHCCLDKA